jgi:hypothetical protein
MQRPSVCPIKTPVLIALTWRRVHPQALEPNPFYLDVREGGLLCYPQLFQPD